MSFKSFFTRQKSSQEEPSIPAYPAPEPDDTCKEQEPIFEPKTPCMRTEQELVLWSQVYFDYPEIKELLSQIEKDENRFCDMIYAILDKFIRKTPLLAKSTTYLKEFLRVFSFKAFRMVTEAGDWFFDEDDIISFMTEYINAVFFICFDYNIDFVMFFDAIKNIPVFATDDCESDPSDEYPWSFSDFTPVMNDGFNRPIMRDQETAEIAEIVSELFETNFEEFLGHAGPFDIEQLYLFEVRYTKILPVFDMLAETLQGEVRSPHLDLIPPDTIHALAQYYPSLTSDIYSCYIHHLITFGINCDFDESTINCVSEYLVETYKTMRILKEYRSEDFSDLLKDAELYLNLIMIAFDGTILTETISFLKDVLGYSKSKAIYQVWSYIESFFFDSNGDSKPIDPNDLANVIRLLSNKKVFDYVLDVKPSIIEALS